MKSLVIKLVRRRNPNFDLDPDLNAVALIQFCWSILIKMIRACRLFLYLRAPKGAMIGSGVTFFNLPKIKWGSFLKLGNQVTVSGLGKIGVIMGDHVSIGDFSRIITSTTFNQLGAYIKIGDHVGIGEYAYLGGAGGLQIGSECIIGQYFSCHPENHNYAELNTSIRHQGVQRKGIKIGNNCWIGSKVTILDGVTIGDGSVIAAGAVVTKSFPQNSIIAGVPAKLINQRKNENESNSSYRLCS